MSTRYQEETALWIKAVERRLEELAPTFLPERSRVAAAARYSLFAGGKRIRAILVLASARLLGRGEETALDFAAAVEMLHCYSLIHDDLPCMDDDDTRRGRPACHRAFDEATALLAGDALQAAAFDVILHSAADGAVKARAAGELAEAAGVRGMVYGQEIDLYFESRKASEEELRLVHRYKTGKLIAAAVRMGAAAAEAGPEDTGALSDFAYALGLAFQIVDDVLDVTATAEELGKPIGSDAQNGKTTFVTLHGAERALGIAQELTHTAQASLQERFGDKADYLVSLADALLTRRM